MDFEEEFELEHLLFTQRKCRSCGAIKDLVTDFYRTRKGRATPSAYAYECKICTVTRITNLRKKDANRWEYPDW
jgi:hypothetical protein